MNVFLDENVPEIKVSYSQNIDFGQETRLVSSVSASILLFDTWDKDLIEFQEEFKVILLNNRNVVKGIYSASKGGVTGAVVDVRIVLAVALKTMSTGIIIAHNHPSGKLVPSEADKKLTKKMKSACECLDIELLDHIIITPQGHHFSFTDQGLL